MASLRLPRQRLFWAVSIGHTVNDAFMAVGVVILTFLSAGILPMTNAQIGLAVSMTQLMGAISQPFLGLRADRTGGRGLGAGGLMWVISMMSLALLLAVSTRNYLLMLIPYVLMGLGSGAFHPVGSLHASESDKHNVSTNLAYFFLLGQLGSAIGPTLVGLLLDSANRIWLSPYLVGTGMEVVHQPTGNLTPVFIMAGVALLPALFMALMIPVRQRAARLSDKGLNWRALPWGVLGLLALMVIIRGIPQPGSINFVPRLFQEKGWLPSEYGFITGMFWLAMGVSGVFMGVLADRYDKRYVLFWTMLASAPAFFLLPHLDGVLAILAALAAGALSGGTHTLLVVLAQQLLPGGKAFASGAMLGFIFGAGALGSFIIGNLSDAIGLVSAFHWIAVCAVLAGTLSLALPKASPKQ